MSPPIILLLDDSASVREVLRVALESEGHSVLEAAYGREGVRLYREHRPALVLVEMVMPEKDGIVQGGRRGYAVSRSRFNASSRASISSSVMFAGQP
jgi:CheY-like chemotaxis protein